LKVLFMGTPSFAVPSLQALLKSKHQVAAAVTQPDRPAGRGLAFRTPPVKDLALERGLPVLQPERIRTAEFLDQVRAFRAEAIVVVAYGRILTPALLDAAPLGGVNVHASLLPKYRGAAPVAWAIASGETISGVTTMRMVERLDAGDILLQRSLPIAPGETAGDLEARLAILGAGLLVDTLDALEDGTMAFLPQREDQATLAPILRKEDARIDWSMPAETVARRVRAFNPRPIAFTSSRGRGMQILRARAVESCGTQGGDGDGSGARPGEVVDAGPGGLRVACGQGLLELLEVQPEGRRRIPAAMAVAGRYFARGDVLV
jgi:methionyl-tRNA formyltransferase